MNKQDASSRWTMFERFFIFFNLIAFKNDFSIIYMWQGDEAFLVGSQLIFQRLSFHWVRYS